MHAEEGHVTVEGSERTPVPGAVRQEPIDDAEDVRVTVLVHRRGALDEAALARGAAQGDSHLSRDEFENRFGADPQDLSRVSSVLERFGLRTVETDVPRRTVVMEGPASAARAAFQVDLARYEVSGRSYRGREGAVKVPAEIADVVEGVFGLDDRPQATPHFQRADEFSALAAAPHVARSVSAIEVAQAYAFPGNTGTGQTIGIVELGGGYLDTDNQAYFGALGLTTPTVVDVSVDGAVNDPNNPVDDGADWEVGLDIQVAGAVAPGARIAVYFAPNTSAGFLDAITTAIHDATNTPSVISISWGAPEDGFWTSQSRDAMEQAFQDAAILGVTVCVASGDHGAADLPATPLPDQRDGNAHVDFPASAPHALACGGTHLELVAGAPAESAWNDANGWATGGGISSVFPVPDYQTGLSLPPSANPGAGVGRGVPDVAGNADIATGYAVHIHGQDTSIGGTSAVAPLWAGLVALLNESLGRPVGFLQPALYPLAGTPSFTDIEDGNNDVGRDNGGYQAAIGWDCCTGLGSPVGSALFAALGSEPPSLLDKLI